MYVNTTATYPLPSFSDAQNDPITVTLISPTPSFATYNVGLN